MVDWVKNGSWKQENYLPTISEKKISTIQVSTDWRIEERRRMGVVYPDGHVHQHIKNMMFGPKVELLF
jgi:hypothetical protein